MPPFSKGDVAAMDAARRKPRSDGLRNRQKLIGAARDVLAQGGPEASLEAVARHAGVGIGTLYRHFPTREALFQAVYRHEVEGLIALADELRKASGGLEAVRAWAHALIRLAETKRGLIGALAVTPGQDSKAMYEELALRMREAVGTLLDAGREGGAVRKGITADDVVSTVLALCYARQPGPGWREGVTRVVDVFIDGAGPQQGPGDRATDAKAGRTDPPGAV